MQLVLEAVAALENASPLSIVTIPALLRAAKEDAVDPSDLVEFGSTEESQLLEQFFVLPRPPDPDRPFRAVWSTKEPWQKRKYPGGGLQRLRTDAAARGRVFAQVKNKPRDFWRLTPQAGSELASTDKPVRLVDLALWMGRDQDVADLDGLLTWLRPSLRQTSLTSSVRCISTTSRRITAPRHSARSRQATI
jgi:hypothetical protein